MADPSLALRRLLRAQPTDAERRLWRLLRDRRIGQKFRHQHSFGRFVVDFYCAAARLVIELDGGQHYEPKQAAYDAHRTLVLEAQGLHVIRFTNLEVLCSSELVLDAIIGALGRPHPNPLP